MRLSRTSKFLSLTNPLPTQMLGDSASVEIQASRLPIYTCVTLLVSRCVAVSRSAMAAGAFERANRSHEITRADPGLRSVCHQAGPDGSIRAMRPAYSISMFHTVDYANKNRSEEDTMHSPHHRSLRGLLLAGTVAFMAAPAAAADVTPQRL